MGKIQVRVQLEQLEQQAGRDAAQVELGEPGQTWDHHQVFTSILLREQEDQIQVLVQT